MQLPIFQGVGIDGISLFLEKTPIEFIKFYKGDIIANPTDGVDSVLCIISGQYSVETFSEGYGELRIVSHSAGPCVLGLDHLFGMSRNYEKRVEAQGDVSVLKFSREDYLKVMSSNRILLLNLLNFVSYRCQQYDEYLATYPYIAPREVINRLVALNSDKGACLVEVSFRLDDFCKSYNKTCHELYDSFCLATDSNHGDAGYSISMEGSKVKLEIYNRLNFLSTFV